MDLLARKDLPDEEETLRITSKDLEGEGLQRFYSTITEDSPKTLLVSIDEKVKSLVLDTPPFTRLILVLSALIWDTKINIDVDTSQLQYLSLDGELDLGDEVILPPELDRVQLDAYAFYHRWAHYDFSRVRRLKWGKWHEEFPLNAPNLTYMSVILVGTTLQLMYPLDTLEAIANDYNGTDVIGEVQTMTVWGQGRIRVSSPPPMIHINTPYISLQFSEPVSYRGITQRKNSDRGTVLQLTDDNAEIVVEGTEIHFPTGIWILNDE